MAKITVSLPDELIWDIKQAGLLERLTQREIIINAVNSFLKKYKSKKELPDYPFDKQQNN